jgi:DNA repair protein RecO (recombination protein O)
VAAASVKRIALEPAYVLHRYSWSESSVILEVFTRHHGRTALVARGAKRPTSGFRPVLLPLQPLKLSYGGDGEIRNLKSAEWVGGHVMPTGAALLSGYYANELLLRLLPRDDAHPALFDGYAALVQRLATLGPARGMAATETPDAQRGRDVSVALRGFELLLLRELGVLPALNLDTSTTQAVQPQGRYALRPDMGLCVARGDDGMAVAGHLWLKLQTALDERHPADALGTVLGAHSPREQAALKANLRGVLHYHCGGTELRTRKLWADLAAL